MAWVGYLFITLAAYAGMEFMAWFTHKYVMHGVLWNWHEDHHRPKHEKHGFFEKNDRFFLVFALPSMACYMVGGLTEHLWALFVGIGISLYGLTYFLIHDVYIHQRFRWFRQLDSVYSRGILRAHGAHHAKTGKDGCESFGLLVVSVRHFKKRQKQQETDTAEQA
ncbi:MAG: fatty acid hydroxylase [Saprospiraceae bacterium]